MSWISRGTSIFRQRFGGKFLKKLATRQTSCDPKPYPPGPADCCPVKSLMDLCIHPEGSWSENYKRQDSKDTQILLFGILNFIIASGVYDSDRQGNRHLDLLMASLIRPFFFIKEGTRKHNTLVY